MTPPDDPRPDSTGLPPVPVGIEHLLALAASSAEFRQALLDDPVGAAEAAGLALSASERAMLGAVPAAALRQMIQRVDVRLDDPDRRAFLERATAAVALLVGGAGLAGTAALAGCEEPKSGEASRRRSIEGGRPSPRPPMDRRELAPTGIRPDRLRDELAPRESPRDAPPRREDPPPDSPRTEPRRVEPRRAPPPDAGAERPRPTRGIRPDRPPQRPRGPQIRAGVRAPEPPTAGIRPEARERPRSRNTRGGVRVNPRRRPASRNTKGGVRPK